MGEITNEPKKKQKEMSITWPDYLNFMNYIELSPL